MNATPPGRPPSEPPQGAPRGPLIALALIVVLVIGAWWISTQIRSSNAIQDCVMAGRHNCAPVGQ